MNTVSKIELLRERTKRYCKPHGNLSFLAGEAGVGLTVVSRFAHNHTTPESENLEKIENALNRLESEKTQPSKEPTPHDAQKNEARSGPQKQSYDWLYHIDVRDLGITPPKRPKKGGKAASSGGAILTDESQAPYTLTEAQVQVIIAMIERRYPDALAIITEILQGKRED